MVRIAKQLTAAAAAAALALPAVAANGPSSPAASPRRGGDAATSVLATSPDQGRFLPRRLPRPVAVRRTGGFLRAYQTVTINEDGHWRYWDNRMPSNNTQGNLTWWQI